MLNSDDSVERAHVCPSCGNLPHCCRIVFSQTALKCLRRRACKVDIHQTVNAACTCVDLVLARRNRQILITPFSRGLSRICLEKIKKHVLDQEKTFWSRCGIKIAYKFPEIVPSYVSFSKNIFY